MLELNELLELEEVIRDVLNDDLERILIELNRTGELETFLRLLGMHDYLGTEAEEKCSRDGKIIVIGQSEVGKDKLSAVAKKMETAKIKETAQTEKTAGTDEQSEPGEIQMEIPDEIMRPDETVNADQKLPFTDPRKEAVEKTEISQEQDDVIRSLLTCISKDRLADFHNALVLFFGEDIGKELYQEAKNSSSYAICRVNQTAISEEEKFDVYCQTVFAYSDPKMDCPEDFSSFLYKANTKRKKLNSLRAALQGHYGKDKGMKYYSLFKSHIKIMNRM